MQINRTTFVLAFVLLGLLPSVAQAQSWYNSSWLYRKAITIDRTKVSGGPHTNFPVLISRADTDLQTKAQTDADDILFTSADGTTKLDHEIESYTSGTGTLVAWVEIPSLSSATDTVIYMYYGNAAATSQQNVTGTWNANYRGVWHLNNAFLDATVNNYDGTNTGTTNVAGKISNGRGFVRSNGADYITITGLMGSPTSFTLSAWATLTTADPNAAEIISLGDDAVLRYDEAGVNGTSGVAYNGGAVWTTTASGIDYAGTGWHYVVYTFDDAANSQRLYVDGVQVASTSAVASPVYTSGGTNTFIGKHGNGNVNFDFDGTIDEVRVSNSSRSAGWALTEFNSQNAPSTFYAVGGEAKTYYSRANGNWNAAATWSNTGHAGAASSTAPGNAAGDIVIVGNSNTVTLNVNVTNQTEVDVNSTGTLNMGTNTISSAGPFTLNSGGTLGVGSTAGITASGATGNVQTTGTRTFSTGANYNYNGTAAQVTGNGLPATVNNLTINNSAGVTLSAGVTVSSDLTVTSGVFSVGAFPLAVTGTTTVTSTLTITSATGAKTFGDLTINGTFNNTAANAPYTVTGDFQNNGTYNGGTGRVTFTGATSNTISGSAATTAFSGGITVNKGVSNANVLDVLSVITLSSGGLTLTNGTFKLSSNSTITPFTADITVAPYLIPATAGLWCNGGTINTTTSMSWSVGGLLRISSGTLNQGSAIGNWLAPKAGASIMVEGGSFNVADRISQVGAIWTFSMTGGVMTLAALGNTTADRPPFNMETAGSSFSMSGGTMVFENPGGSAGQNLGYYNIATGGTGFTGGTLQIGNASTPAGQAIKIETTIPIYNLTINSANVTAQLQTNAITVANNLTISSGTLNANNLSITVGGNWTNNVSTAAFTAGTGTVTFNGTAAGGSIGGSFATTFNSLTMNRANGLSLGANITAGGTLTFTSGNITTGSNSLYLSSTGTVSRTSGHVIGNFQKNIATGATSKTFEIGDAINYTPVIVSFSSVTTAGDLTASTTVGDHASIGTSTINATKSVNRNWTLTNSGIVFTNYSATFTFVAGDVDGGASTSAFGVGKYSGGSWTYPTVGTKTATTTQATGLTAFSDFQLGELAPTYNVSGNVFEDVNYGGGAGRSLVTSSGVARASARVELFDAAGSYQTFTTTDVSGNYTFSSLAAGTYTVRVVNGSVTSSRGGSGLLPVQTFRTNASSGAAVDVTDHVGGETPALADAGNGSTTLAALTTGTTTAQSITSVVLSSSNITGVDFGYSFNVIVNKNNTGQGSLRQFLTNANALSNTGLAQSGLTAGIDNAVFMLADGTARPGLTASYATQFASSIASITLVTVLPTITDPVILDASLQPGYATVPMIELNGAAVANAGLTITSGSSTVRGFIINRFTGATTGIGISMSAGGSNTITGNYIGTNALGTAASANAFEGIFISSADNIIGGISAAARNVISGNTSRGIEINGAGATGNLVRGNYIGTNVAGTAALANGSGVFLSGGATGNTIGGATAAARNVISGNTAQGIQLEGAGTTGNLVQGNYIGVNPAGTAALANNTGIYVLNGASNNTIGGTAAGAGNLISGNSFAGVRLNGSTVTGNVMQGNYIGTNAAGTAAVANVTVGVYIHSSANNNTVGGTTAAARNIISGNTTYGLILQFSATANSVQGNYIGTNVDGTAAVANGIGVYVLNTAPNNTIGGTVAGAGNVISGNTTQGIQLDGVGTTGNLVQGNYIGTNAAGNAALANSGIGVYVLSGAAGNTIGGTAAGAGNLISGNAGKGVVIAAGTGNAILSNSIYANTGIGIDLTNDGVTANDGTKSGALANSGMDTPVFSTVTLVGTTLTISGYVGSAAGQATFASASVQVFKSDNDATGFGEGQTFLGTLTTDASGNFSGTLTVSLAVGDKITGTATDGSNNTSEFGINATVAYPPPNVALLNTVTPSGTQPPGTDLVYTVAFTNDGGQPAQVFIVIDPIPADTDFKLGSPSTDLGTTGMTVAVEYSNDNASTWTYTPVSGGGGALAGYDRAVTHVRWRFTGNLSQTSPNNTGSVGLTARIR